MTDSNELREMREQLTVLKEKLKQEEILTDKLIRRAMQGQVRKIRRQGYVSIIGGVVALTAGNHVWKEMGMSVWFIVFTSLMMLVCIVIAILIHTRLSETDVHNGDLLSVACKAKQLKTEYQRWHGVGLPLGILWLLWLVAEQLWRTTDLTDTLYYMMGIVCGAVFGGIVGYRMHRRVLCECDDLIRQIEE